MPSPRLLEFAPACAGQAGLCLFQRQGRRKTLTLTPTPSIRGAVPLPTGEGGYSEIRFGTAKSFLIGFLGLSRGYFSGENGF